MSDKNILYQYLLNLQKNKIDQIKRENLDFELIIKILPGFETYKNTFLYKFKVIKSNRKLKINNLKEEKVLIHNKYKGKIVDSYENTIIISINQNINIKNILNIKLILKSLLNHNNELLLKKYEDFLKKNYKLNEIIFNNINITNKEINFEQNFINIDIDLLNNHKFFNKNLNLSQKKSVLYSLKNIPYKIIGPPGTGKTETITEIIYLSLKLNKKILICGPSNISIDNILERYIKNKNVHFTENFYRLGSSFKGLTKYNLENLIENATSFIKKEKNEKNFEKEKLKIKNIYTKRIKEKSNLVFSTLFSSLKIEFNTSKEEEQNFDLCIIDECCQGDILESFMAIIKSKSFILVGDPCQINNEENLFIKIKLLTFLLDTQYRMPENLIKFSNENFYENKLKSFNKSKEEDINSLFINNTLFIDTSFSDYSENDAGQSKSNKNECDLIKKVLKVFDLKKNTIGIITPYSAQVYKIKKTIEIDIDINTIDGFQGQEKDIIIISLVRSNLQGEIGFLKDYKRFNVAITRCKKKLVVIGDSFNFRKDKFFKKFFKYLENECKVIDVETFNSLL